MDRISHKIPENMSWKQPMTSPPKLSRRRFLLLSSLGVAGVMGLGALFPIQRWRYIVIHHSAGQFGDLRFLNEVHRQRQPHDPIDSMAYHVVIGNGNGLALGEVKYGLRWQKGLWGAHVSTRNHRYNFFGIGICLIGNYHEHSMPERQYESLVRLVRSLKEAYGIHSSAVYAHGRLDGERTVCPGRYFPYRRFRLDIA